MKPSKKAITSGYVAQALNIGYGVLILPFMLVFLSPAEVSYWLVLLSFLGLVMVFDFGFSPTITRNVAYVMSGAQTLQAQGVCSTNNSGEPNWKLFGQLYQTVKKLYFYIALIGLIVFGCFGTWYVNLFLDNNPIVYGWQVWLIFLIGFIFNLYFLFTQPLLMGIGSIYQANMTNIIMRGLWLLLSLVGLWWFETILVMPIAYLLGVFFARIYAYVVLNQKIVFIIFKKSRLLKVLLPNAWRLGVVMLGAFLINKATIFFAGIYFTADVSASYMITLQVLSVVMALSNVYFQMHIPQLSGMQLELVSSKKKLYYKLVLVSLLIYAFFAFGIMLFGDLALSLLSTDIVLLPISLLSLILFFGFLELHHSLAGMYITTLNEVPFVWSAVLSGSAIVGLIVFVFSYLKMDSMIWLILIQGLVQLAYNNWKWPLVVYKKLQEDKSE
ncbi:O-unit flippase-like protein [Hydrogenovibrio thermophilus]|uniref:Polysaccharide biosynthesis protein n=1 Tax=Hydrogenovibrio thermophilus TaxID=265883 RepID=A0A410H4G5_9GAMM|nr:O-unit flippase-like protein [Hydrogenovibrio thermophilus]QAB15787.1 hypothetical protein EPV75_08945 [Hydrogenovibrio thermophilus]